MQIDTTEDIQTAIRIACRNIIAFWDEMVPRGVKARSTGTIGRSSERVDPIGASILDIRREALMTLNFAANVILTERELVGVSYDGDDAIALAGLVDRHYDWLARHEMGWELAEELAEHARAVKGMANRGRLEDMVFLGPCVCGEPINARSDVEMVECPACQTVTHRDDLRHAAVDVKRDVLITAREAEVMGGPKPATIRQWAKRGKLAPLACDIADHALRYRFGDVLSLTKHAC